MIYLSKGGGGRCRFGPYVDPPLGEVQISSKNCWPLPEVGHITPNVEWFSVVRPYKKHELFQIPIFDSLCNIQIILSKMFQILNIHDI